VPDKNLQLKKLGTLEREFQDTEVNIFSWRQNARSELKRCVIRVWPWPWTFDPGREFVLSEWPLNFDLELKLSHFQVAIKDKMCSHDATYPWSMGFTTRQKSQFQAAKMQKMCSDEARYPWTWISRLGTNCIFWAPKCTKWANAMCHSFLTLTFDPGHGLGLFARPLNFDLVFKLSHFQVAIKEKMCSHEAT